MWTRSGLKARAKEVLRGNYWKAFLISLVIAFASGGGGGGGGGGSASWNQSGSWNQGGGSNWPFGNSPFSNTDSRFFLIAGALLAVIGVVIAAGIAIRIFLGYPLEVGGRRYFVQSAQYFDNRRCFRFAFDGHNYLGIVGAMLLKGIFNFLWFLLFIIPGIVKGYAYSMVPYILADNPNIGARRAIELSNNMTQGHKFDMFVLDLSFIGWYLLGALAFGIGVFFVAPYEDATKGELYLALRQNAIEQRMCSLSELNLFEPSGEYNQW